MFHVSPDIDSGRLLRTVTEACINIIRSVIPQYLSNMADFAAESLFTGLLLCTQTFYYCSNTLRWSEMQPLADLRNKSFNFMYFRQFSQIACWRCQTLEGWYPLSKNPGSSPKFMKNYSRNKRFTNFGKLWNHWCPSSTMWITTQLVQFFFKVHWLFTRKMVKVKGLHHLLLKLSEIILS